MFPKRDVPKLVAVGIKAGVLAVHLKILFFIRKFINFSGKNGPRCFKAGVKDEEHRYPNGKLEKIESFATQRNIPKEILITPTEETTAENALKFLEENLQSKVEKLKGQGLERKIKN